MQERSDRVSAGTTQGPSGEREHAKARGSGGGRGGGARVQLKSGLRGQGFEEQSRMLAPRENAVQHKAAAGVAGSGSTLPHLGAIQASFGRHDVSGVQAHVGGAAREASEAIGADAYATGDRVAFASAPDLHTAAHEAAHVVQQKNGVSLSNGVGEAGDRYEQHADRVADAVVAGRSAEALLSQHAGGTAEPLAVQRVGLGGGACGDEDHKKNVGDTAPVQLEETKSEGDYEDQRAQQELEDNIGLVTGTWSVDASDEDNKRSRITFAINQAGKHLEVWWSWLNQPMTVHDPDAYTGRVAAKNGRFAAEFIGDKLDFLNGKATFATAGGKFGDTLAFSKLQDKGRLDIEANGEPVTLERGDHSPTLSDAAIEAMPEDVQPLVEADQRTPLDDEQLAEIDEVVDALIDSGGLIRTYLDVGKDFDLLRADAKANAAELINKRLIGLFTHFAPEQEPLATRRIQERLLDVAYEHEGVERTAWDWLVVILLVHDQPSAERLGISGDASALGGEGAAAAQIEYEWCVEPMVSAGVDVEVASFQVHLGLITIRQQDTASKSWKQLGTYYTVLGESSIGDAGLGSGRSEWMPMSSPFPYEYQHFLGSYGVGAGGGSVCTFYGDGTWPAISGECPAFLADSIGAAGGVGELFEDEQTALNTRAQRRKLSAVEAESSSGDKTAVHFEVDSAKLTEEGRQALRVMCAEHLALFTEGASLHVEAHTSRTQSWEANEALSQMRADNTLTAIRDILGSREFPNAVAEGFGEMYATIEGMPDDTESAYYRRVDVRVNGVTRLTLR